MKLKTIALLAILLPSAALAQYGGMHQNDSDQWVNSSGGNLYGNSNTNWKADPNMNWEADPNMNWEADPNMNWKADPSLSAGGMYGNN